MMNYVWAYPSAHALTRTGHRADTHVSSCRCACCNVRCAIVCQSRVPSNYPGVYILEVAFSLSLEWMECLEDVKKPRRVLP